MMHVITCSNAFTFVFFFFLHFFLLKHKTQPTLFSLLMAQTTPEVPILLSFETSL